jgi:L-lactate dehydrogenase complex protein LldG
MTERENILARVREALKVPAPRPGSHHAGGAHPKGAAHPASRAGEWLPPVGESFDQQLAAFAINAADLRAELHTLNDATALAAVLCAQRDAGSWRKVATHTGTLTAQAVGAMGLPVCYTDRGYDVNELEACDVGITECDALIAQTGSVLVTNRSCGGRALSVLPPHHLVLARRDQLIRDLPAAFQLLQQKYAANYPSMISFITGPSRTGDIERILVLGAHGPKKLTILLV